MISKMILQGQNQWHLSEIYQRHLNRRQRHQLQFKDSRTLTIGIWRRLLKISRWTHLVESITNSRTTPSLCHLRQKRKLRKVLGHLQNLQESFLTKIHHLSKPIVCSRTTDLRRVEKIFGRHPSLVRWRIILPLKITRTQVISTRTISLVASVHSSNNLRKGKHRNNSNKKECQNLCNKRRKSYLLLTLIRQTLTMRQLIWISCLMQSCALTRKLWTLATTKIS